MQPIRSRSHWKNRLTPLHYTLPNSNHKQAPIVLWKGIVDKTAFIIFSILATCVYASFVVPLQRNRNKSCGISTSVVHELPKLRRRVRLPYAALARSVTWSQRLMTPRSVTRLREWYRSALSLKATRTSASPDLITVGRTLRVYFGEDTQNKNRKDYFLFLFVLCTYHASFISST